MFTLFREHLIPYLEYKNLIKYEKVCYVLR